MWWVAERRVWWLCRPSCWLAGDTRLSLIKDYRRCCTSWVPKLAGVLQADRQAQTIRWVQQNCVLTCKQQHMSDRSTLALGSLT